MEVVSFAFAHITRFKVETHFINSIAYYEILLVSSVFIYKTMRSNHNYHRSSASSIRRIRMHVFLNAPYSIIISIDNVTNCQMDTACIYSINYTAHRETMYKSFLNPLLLLLFRIETNTNTYYGLIRVLGSVNVF